MVQVLFTVGEKCAYSVVLLLRLSSTVYALPTHTPMKLEWLTMITLMPFEAKNCAYELH